MTALISITEPRDAGYFTPIDREAAKEEVHEELLRRFASTLAKPWPLLNRLHENRCCAIFNHAVPAIDGDEKKATVFNTTLLSGWVDPNSLWPTGKSAR